MSVHIVSTLRELMTATALKDSLEMEHTALVYMTRLEE